MISTNWYSPYTNSLTIKTLDGHGTAVDGVWTIVSYPTNTFTNSSAYLNQGLSGQNEETYANIPTGTYIVAYSALTGYTTPGRVTNAVVDAVNPVSTGIYTRVLGSISIVLNPTNATWTVTPPDLTEFTSYSSSRLSGTNNYTLTNTPVGAYTVTPGSLSGYTAPAAQTQTSTTNSTNLTFTFTYTIGPRVTVIIYEAGDGVLYGGATNYPAGIGYGGFSYAGGSVSGVSSNRSTDLNFMIGDEVTLTARPATNLPVGTNFYDSWFYFWAGQIDPDPVASNYPYTYSTVSNITFTMTNLTRTVYLLFSRELYHYDNVPDLDSDGLPDAWENSYGLNPMDNGSFNSTNGPYGNADRDWIPSISANPPWRYSVDTNEIATYAASNQLSTVGYPLIGGQYTNLGYCSTNYSFNNLLECRGLDGYYQTNGVVGAVVNDDPGTDPRLFDTRNPDTPKVSDGWKYYFWYWRAVNGLTNSPQLDWVTVRPLGDVADEDDDWDGLSNLEEYSAKTDPTHCDTDADGMDDWWEANNSTVLSPLNPRDNPGNPDNDFCAVSSRLRILTNGMHSTVLTNSTYRDVYYAGNSNSPSAAWISVYTNSGTNVFDLYRDPILMVQPNAVLTNRQTGGRYNHTNYYGTNASMPAYQPGYPVWVDINDDGMYSTNTDVAIVNPFLKHDLVYQARPDGWTFNIPADCPIIIGTAPTIWETFVVFRPGPFPGVTSFDPRTAWFGDSLTVTNRGTNTITIASTNTLPYTSYREYSGGDYLGRIAWDMSGRLSAENDDDFALTRRSYTDPNSEDTDSDLMPDGWELYVGLDPRNPGDAGLNPDGPDDALTNVEEWQNIYHTLHNCSTTWPTKLMPTDPGAITAPAPNDPHPQDTDWDGVYDSDEQTEGTDPTSWDTDMDGLPDGWEIFAGTSAFTNDTQGDLDGDGLLNWQEYWTGTVKEWQYTDSSWDMNFSSRRQMYWDPAHAFWADASPKFPFFVPPDYLSCGSAIFIQMCKQYDQYTTTSEANITQVETDIRYWIDYLRAFLPASGALMYDQYHTTQAVTADSDEDGMDDYWEVYHGLSPCQGFKNLMMPNVEGLDRGGGRNFPGSGYVDADPATAGYQMGELLTATPTFRPFTNIMNIVNYFSDLRALTTDPVKIARLNQLVGPFNFGLEAMDPDADMLLNYEEYAVRGASQLPMYHTDPTPFYWTDEADALSFINQNYGDDITQYFNGITFFGLIIDPHKWSFLFNLGTQRGHPFKYEMNEGFDTDNDAVSDYAEINATGGVQGHDPLDSRNPIRNRVMYLNGTNAFLKVGRCRSPFSEASLARYTIEAWIKPDSVTSATNRVIVETSANYPLEGTNGGQVFIGLQTFQLGLRASGAPYIMYHGRNSMRAYEATAVLSSPMPTTSWTHLAGVYDGTNLTIYVNGELNRRTYTTELPANGICGNYAYHPNLTTCVGAHDSGSAGSGCIDGSDGGSMAPIVTNFFKGCVDEIRIWDSVRSLSLIQAFKNVRLTWGDIEPLGGITTDDDYIQGNNGLYSYYSFDDVPDPAIESIVPQGLFDFDSGHRRHPTLTWWLNATNWHSTVYTGSVDQAYNYIVFAEDHVNHMRRVPPLDIRSTNILSSVSNTLHNTHGPYNPMYSASIYVFIPDLVICGGARAVATNSWLGSLDPGNPDSTDADGDGMPDWWEQLHGLDPNDASGDQGAWGDLDSDGLDNIAEYWAGTDPRNSDTAGTGLGDYDSQSGPYSRTWGEMYMDGDGMPDTWEVAHSLDPRYYDANLDKDEDGWSNYAEYMAGTDPNDRSSYPLPSIGGRIKYFGVQTNGLLVIMGYQTNTMDGVPTVVAQAGTGGGGTAASELIGIGDGQTKVYSGTLQHANIVQGSVVVRRRNNMFVCPDYDFGDDASGNWVLFLNYTSSIDANQYVQFDYITGNYTFTWPTGSPNVWDAPWAGDMITIEYEWQESRSDSYRISGFKEGDVYFFCFRDLNNNDKWDIGEPCGRLERQPQRLEWHNVSEEAVIGISDSFPGYNRFTWTVPTGTGSVAATINYLSREDAPTVLIRTITAPRNYIFEWDYNQAGVTGLVAGTYQWWAGNQNGIFTIQWPGSFAKPFLHSPRGDILIYARNEMTWQMDTNSVQYHLQIQDKSGRMLHDDYHRAPYRDNDGLYRDFMPKYAGEIGNGTNWWRIAGWTPAGESAWSDWQTFEVLLSTTNARWIGGDVYYFGKAGATNIVVEAFANSSFSGEPAARQILALPCTTNNWKGAFRLYGLKQQTYYVRAWLDVTPALGGSRNNAYDTWESVGFVRDPMNTYQPRGIGFTNTLFMDGLKIVVRDHDTDNDRLPDAWEMMYFGNLDQTGDMDYDGDGETNLEEYMLERLDTDPSKFDTDGDGLTDYYERWSGGNTYNPYHPALNPTGRSLNPIVWDTDGDGYSDGAEIRRYHTNPLDPNSRPGYGPLCVGPDASPADYDGDGRSDVSVYDPLTANWHAMTWYGQYYQMPFGGPGAQPVLGDFDNDGRTDLGVYDSQTGNWHVFTMRGGYGVLQFGNANTLPMPGDYDGDFGTDLGLYDQTTGMWYVYTLRGQFACMQFGAPGLIPAPGDYDGDGRTDLGVYDPATGMWYLYTMRGQFFQYQFGGPTLTPVPGDYDGDGRSDAALYDRAGGWWHIMTWRGLSVSGQFGGPTMIPVSGDYDGDGRREAAIYNLATGNWYVYLWSGQILQGQFGVPGMAPVTAGR